MAEEVIIFGIINILNKEMQKVKQLATQPNFALKSLKLSDFLFYDACIIHINLPLESLFLLLKTPLKTAKYFKRPQRTDCILFC